MFCTVWEKYLNASERSYLALSFTQFQNNFFYSSTPIFSYQGVSLIELAKPLSQNFGEHLNSAALYETSVFMIFTNEKNKQKAEK